MMHPTHGFIIHLGDKYRSKKFIISSHCFKTSVLWASYGRTGKLVASRDSEQASICTFHDVVLTRPPDEHHDCFLCC